MKTKIEKVLVTHGVCWISIPDADVEILCGCPADIIKHVRKLGLIKNIEKDGVAFESGPNVLLLSDTPIQNGQFSSLAEFPILQMLYMQGMILPNHPNNNGDLPIMAGNSDQLAAQMQYIYRGNYGLISEEEIMETGISKDLAQEFMRLKLKFAFGKIKNTSEFIKGIEVKEEAVEIKNSCYIKRLSINKFEIRFEDETAIIDLNLKKGEKYSSPYRLGYFSSVREHFAVIHSGEGDGWDVFRPCMSSVLIYDGYIYLIDAGPNLLDTLTCLGISVSEIMGIFHTHCHDDHFSGLTTLIQADHRIKYYATPLIRASVSKKLSALLSTHQDVLTKYFDVVDLDFNDWNFINGMLVKPTFSPHPVETNNFTFKVIADGDFKQYAHLADTSSFDILKNMINEDLTSPGITNSFFEKVKKNYLAPVDLKKIDIGGGLIHGQAKDFKEDLSTKIILSHTSKDLTMEEKEIGTRTSFGMVDVLIPSNNDLMDRYALRFIQAYFPQVQIKTFRDILNCQITLLNPGDIILKKGQINNYVYLTLTGTIEMIQSENDVDQYLPAGSLIGDISALKKVPIQETYVTQSFVNILKIPVNIYSDFVERNKLSETIYKTQKNLDFLRTLWVFGEIAYSPALNKIARNMKFIIIKKGEELPQNDGPGIILIYQGTADLHYKGKLIEKLKTGDFCHEDIVLEKINHSNYSTGNFEDRAIIYHISTSLIEKLPAVLWRLLETHERRVKIGYSEI